MGARVPVSARTVQELLQAGVTGDALVRIIAAIDQDMTNVAVSAPRSAGAERQARYRQRKLASSITSDVTRYVTSDVTEPEIPSCAPAFFMGEEEVVVPPQTATLSSAPKGADDRKRGRRIREDWEPNEGHRALGAQLGLSAEQFKEITTEFKDYWLSEAGARARKIDWDRTFTNRLKDRAKYFTKSSNSNGKFNGKHSLVEAARNVHERIVANGIVSLGDAPPPVVPPGLGGPTQPIVGRLLSDRRGG